eukprot:404081_1
MSEAQSCSTASLVTTKVVYSVFGVVYGLVLISVSIYSYLLVMKEGDKFRLRSWMLDVYRRRHCYLPMISHLTDWITDTGVIIQFGTLAYITTKADCNGLDMNVLFALSIFILLFYRTISSLLIYNYTKSCKRFLMQFIDFEIFRTLYVNYLCDKTEPCSPQKWINSLEAAFESSPQALIQMVYLVKTGSFGASLDVVLSLILSLMCIISKIISDDKVISVKEAKRILNIPKPTVDNSQSFQIQLMCSRISWKYICRYIWRILDVSSKILITSLLWLALGGYYVSFIIICEVMVFLIICIKTRRFEFLFGVVAMVISRSENYPNAKKISIGIMIYRHVTNTFFMIIILVLVNVNRPDDKCWKCSDFEEVQQYFLENLTIYSILIYCTIAVMITPILSRYLYLNVFKENKSPSRKLEDMIQSQNWNGIIEMQTYKEIYGVYHRNTNLLMLSVEYNYGKLVKFLSTQAKVNLEAVNDDGNCVLDYIKLAVRHEYYKKNKRYLGELLVLIARKYPTMRTQNNETPIMLSCYIDDVTSFAQLTELQNQAAELQNQAFYDAWNMAENADQPDIIEWLLENKPKHNMKLPDYSKDEIQCVKQMVMKRKTNILDMLLTNILNQYDQYELWFWMLNDANIDDISTIETVKKHMVNVNMCNTSGQTALHIACNKFKQDRDDKLINYLQQNINHDVTDNFGCMAMDYLKTYKFMMLSNAAGVGRKTLINHFVHESAEAKANDSHCIEKDFDGHIFNIQILERTINSEADISLQMINNQATQYEQNMSTKNESIETDWIKEIDIFVLLFPINKYNSHSFKQIRTIRQQIIKNKPETQNEIDTIIPILLVGTKCDLTDERNTMDSMDELNIKCRKWNDKKYPNANVKHKFIKTSAKQNINVSDIFAQGIKLYCQIKHDVHTVIANKFESRL